MKVVTATLCDFGQIREGLLSVLSGGITRLKRPAFPAPLGCHLALILEMSSIELEDTREVSVRLSDERVSARPGAVPAVPGSSVSAMRRGAPHRS